MRVNYTLPGLQPQVHNLSGAAAAKAASSARASFREHVRRLSAALPVFWKELLRLDKPPMQAGYVGPPPRPASLDIHHSAAERIRWRSMLDRRAQEFTENPPPGQDGASIERMLALLMRLQELEDGVVSRHLSETQG